MRSPKIARASPRIGLLELMQPERAPQATATASTVHFRPTETSLLSDIKGLILVSWGCNTFGGRLVNFGSLPIDQLIIMPLGGGGRRAPCVVTRSRRQLVSLVFSQRSVQVQWRPKTKVQT